MDAHLPISSLHAALNYIMCALKALQSAGLRIRSSFLTQASQGGYHVVTQLLRRSLYRTREHIRMCSRRAMVFGIIFDRAPGFFQNSLEHSFLITTGCREVFPLSHRLT